MSGEKVMLKVALPTGKLEPETIRLFHAANIPVVRDGRKLVVELHNGTVQEIRFVKAPHVPEVVARGICDVGICGEDSVAESIQGWSVRRELRLPYGMPGRDGKTKVALCCSAHDHPQIPYYRPQPELVVSEYPRLSKEFFKRERWQVEIVPSRGGTEALIPDIYQWGVCLVETGETLRANGLKVHAVLLEASTVMISGKYNYVHADVRAQSRYRSAIQNLRGRLLEASKTLFR